MRRVIASVSGVALGAAALVAVANPPALAVGCALGAPAYDMDYNTNPPTPFAKVTIESASQGVSCSDSWTVPSDVTGLEYAIVAGGGGAGDDTNLGGAGGAGGFLNATVSVTPGQSLPVVIGEGGDAAALGGGGDGESGGNTSITIGSPITAIGGGGGGGPARNGLSGGSGGGGGIPSGSGGTGVAGQGYDGAAAAANYGGGGGGASGAAVANGGGNFTRLTWTTKVSFGGNGAPGSLALGAGPGTGGSQLSANSLPGENGIIYLRWTVASPGAPTSVTGTPGDGQVTVQWTDDTTGGAPIAYYDVRYSSDGGNTWIDDSIAAPASSYSVTGLTNGTGYVFEVRAVNAAHVVLPNDVAPGPYSSVSATVTPTPAPPTPPTPIPPSAPTRVSAVGGNGQASVSWGAPANPGSFPVTSYQVTAAPGGQSCLTSSTSCTITGLTNGTTYTFSVAALNGAGWGAAAVSNSVTPSANPTPTPAPGPQPLPAPLAPGGWSLTVNGVAQQMTVAPNPQTNGLTIVSDDFDMSLDGLGPDGLPLDLGPDGVLVLDQERQAQSSGRGFLGRSDVDFYIDPPVAATARSARSAGTYVGTLVTAGDGTFTGTVTLPDSIVAGDHVLQAVGLTAQGQPRAVSIGVRVNAWIQLDQGVRSAAGRHDRVRTSGDSAGIPAGTRLTPWIRYAGQGEFKQGVAAITVESDGSFTWTRQIKKSKGLTAYVSYTVTESNRVFWAKVR